jgi:hypothetical protein
MVNDKLLSDLPGLTWKSPVKGDVGGQWWR